MAVCPTVRRDVQHHAAADGRLWSDMTWRARYDRSTLLDLPIAAVGFRKRRGTIGVSIKATEAAAVAAAAVAAAAAEAAEAARPPA